MEMRDPGLLREDTKKSGESLGNHVASYWRLGRYPQGILREGGTKEKSNGGRGTYA